MHFNSSRWSLTTALLSPRHPTVPLANRKAADPSDSLNNHGCQLRCNRLDCRRWFYENETEVAFGTAGTVVADGGRTRILLNCGCHSRWRSRLRSRRRSVGAGQVVDHRWRFRGSCVYLRKRLGDWRSRRLLDLVAIAFISTSNFLTHVAM